LAPQRQPGIKASVFRDLPAFLEAKGADFVAICQNLGMDHTNFVDKNLSLDVVVIDQVLESAAIATNQPNLGLEFRKFVQPGASGLFGQLQATSTTVRQLLRTTAEYGELAIRPVTTDFREDALGGVFTSRIVGLDIRKRRQLTDLLMALLVERIRMATGPNWVPSSVWFETPEPDDSHLYYDIFGEDISFDEQTFGLTVPLNDLDAAISQTAIGLFDTLRPLAEEELASLREKETISGLVASTIRIHLAEASSESRRLVTLQDIADRLEVSPRTLQWRLAQAYTSFDVTLRSVRLDLAQTYLKDDRMSIAEVSAALGFAEPSVFSRWSVRLLGGNPTEVRRRLQAPEG